MSTASCLSELPATSIHFNAMSQSHRSPPSHSSSLAATRSLSTLEGRRLYLAVDCGGTKAAAAISVSSETPGGQPIFLAQGYGGPANYTDVGLSRFLKSVRQAVENALDNAGIHWTQQYQLSTEASPSGDFERGQQDRATLAETSSFCSSSPLGSPRSSSSSFDDSDHASSSTSFSSQWPAFSFPPLFYAAWLGIAGVDSPHNVAVLSPHLSRLLAIPYPSARLIVANDTSLLASPVVERDADDGDVKEGVVAIAGTGSIVMSFRSRKQQQHHQERALSATTYATPRKADVMLEAVGRIGGFGWLLGDEASGFMVGRQAIRAVLEQADQENLGLDDEDDDDGNEDGEDENKVHISMTLPNAMSANGTSSTSTLLDAPTVPTLDRKHLLRDHILAEWSLNSVGDLLDAVYSENLCTLQHMDLNSPRQFTDSARSPSHGGRGELASEEGAVLHGSRQRLAAGSMAISSPAATAKSAPTTSSSHNFPMTPTTHVPSAALDHKGSGQSLTTPSALTLLMEGHRLPAMADDSITRSQAGATDTCDENYGPPSSSGRRPSSCSASSHKSSSSSTEGARKQRLASLAPLVFDLAFNHGDELSLGILRQEIRELATQIGQLLAKPQQQQKKKRAILSPNLTEGGQGASASADSGRLVQPQRSVLCLGGSLLGVAGYRQLLVDELKSRNLVFRSVQHVEDVAKRGSEALACSWEVQNGLQGESKGR